jgi:hypothetical protein
MTAEQWRRRDFGGLPPEYREALLPLAYQTDIVVVPIAGSSPPGEPSAPGWKGNVIHRFRRWLADLQRGAPGPASANQGIRHFLADLLYSANAWLAGGETVEQWRKHTDRLTRSVLEVAHRDPGARVLVAVNVRHCHLIRGALRKKPEVEVVRYFEL